MTNEQPDEPVPRRHRRWTVNIQAVVRIENEPRFCTVFDISPGGAWIEAEEATQATVGATAELGLENFPLIPAEICHKAENTLGLVFLHDGEAEAELGRYLVSRRPERTEPRKAVGIDVTLIPFRERMACTLTDVSRLGASLAIGDARHLSVGDEVMLSIPDYGEVPAMVVRVAEDHVGLFFRKALIGNLPGQTIVRPGRAICAAPAPASLPALRRVDAVKADTLSGDLDRVTVDHAGRAGDVGQGEGREEREQEGQSEHDGRV